MVLKLFAKKTKKNYRFATASETKRFFLCPSGEIGRHTILRGWRCKACEFESRLGHYFEMANFRIGEGSKGRNLGVNIKTK